MTDLTIERVRELIHGYDDATQAKSKSGGWPNPEYADAESARVARYWLLNRYGPLAFGRLVLSLDAQLQQGPADENSKLRLAAGQVQTLIEQQWEHAAKTMRPYDQGITTGLERALTLMSSILDGGDGL